MSWLSGARRGRRRLSIITATSSLYALSSFRRKLTVPRAKATVLEVKAGDVFWVKEQDHVGEDIGETPTHVLLVELKELSPGPGKP